MDESSRPLGVRIRRFLMKPSREKLESVRHRLRALFPRRSATIRLPFGAKWALEESALDAQLRSGAFERAETHFVEGILRSDRYGPAGVVQSTAWGQFRPGDGTNFQKLRNRIERRARRMLPFVANGRPVKGLVKIGFKLARSRVPRAAISAADWAALVSQARAD